MTTCDIAEPTGSMLTLPMETRLAPSSILPYRSKRGVVEISSLRSETNQDRCSVQYFLGMDKCFVDESSNQSNFFNEKVGEGFLSYIIEWIQMNCTEADFMNVQFVEVSGHNLEIFHTCGFCMYFLNHR